VFLILNFVYEDRSREEKVIEKTNRNFIRKKRVWKKNGNYGVRILRHDNMLDFG